MANWLESMLASRLLTPGPMILWWLDAEDKEDVYGWSKLLERFLRECCTFEIVEIEPESWPWIVVGAGVQVARMRAPFWCERASEQFSWYGRVAADWDNVVRKLVLQIPYIEYDHQWHLERIRDDREKM